mgnify:CR=1 FL=1
METVRVSDWLAEMGHRNGVPISPVLGEPEAELLFYALKSLTLDEDVAPEIELLFDWSEAYYSSEFFALLFSFIVDDEDFPYFAWIIRHSDLVDCPERQRLSNIAWDRLGLDEEVLA